VYPRCPHGFIAGSRYALFMNLFHRSIVVSIVLPALAFGAMEMSGCSSKESSTSRIIPSDAAAALLIDRNWIDKMPESHTDRLHVFRFVPSMGGGVYQDRTLFKGTFELFVYKVKGDSLDVVLPETHERATTKYTIETVTGPAPFDLKLTLSSLPRGPQIFFGIRAETDRNGAGLETRLSAAAAKL
jgi:hypothetical protein